MNERTSERKTTRRIHSVLIAGPLVVTAAIVAVLGFQLREPPAGVPTPPVEVRPDVRRLPGEADGVVPDGTTVFDDWVPAVGRLNPALLDALRRAARDAAVDGVEFVVNSGWRSPEYQEQLLREAVLTHGSVEEAARWVADPSRSAHVSGDAVDIGPYDATAWLSEYGARYGLCQIYSNEPWHFELRPDAVQHGCPAMYADPTHDPRMQDAPLPSVPSPHASAGL